MITTRLNLPADLKHRLERLACAANQTPPAFMRDALARAVQRAELPAGGAVEDVGERISLAAAFDFLMARVSGARPVAPRARPARASK